MTVKEFIYYTFKYGLFNLYSISRLKKNFYHSMTEKGKRVRGWTTFQDYLNARLRPIRYGIIFCNILFFIFFIASIGSVFLISSCKNDIEYAVLLFIVLYLGSIYFFTRLHWYEEPKAEIEDRTIYKNTPWSLI